MGTGWRRRLGGRVLGICVLGIATALLPGVERAQAADVVTMQVDPAAENHPISPLIYGINSFATSGPTSDGFGFRRLGGNRITGYNWETNASNGAADWHHQNDSHMGVSDEPAIAILKPAAATLSQGGTVLVTIPMVDRVAADKKGDGDIAKTPDFVHTRLVPNAPRRGSAFPASPDISDHAVFQDEFIAYLKAKLPDGFTPGACRVFFALDNEADLWPETHPRLMGSADVHADPTSDQAFMQRSVAYSEAIKAVAPGCPVFGPVSFGWPGMRHFQGAGIDGHAAPDFLDTYLAFMRDQEKAKGQRLLDVLDVHWYPSDEVKGVRITGAESDPAMQAARIAAPRSLWDSRFIEPSWIGKWNGAVRLLPRLKDEIAQNYPATPIAITEYNYGGPNDISGAIAEADVLGIFGREGVYAAALWPLAEHEPFIHAGIAMFQNYDGNGARFENTSVKARTSDDIQTSIYAAKSSADAAKLTIVVINKKTAPIIARLAVTGSHAKKASVYRLSVNPSEHSEPVVTQAKKGAFDIPMPPLSVVTVVLQ